MTEPSLSADLAAALQSTTASVCSLFRSLKELSHTVDVDSNMKAARLDALEKKTNGLIQTRADHGHQFIVIIDRVKALEKRVAALEGHVEMIADSCLVADQHYELRERVAALEQMADILNLKESIFKRVTVLEKWVEVEDEWHEHINGTVDANRAAREPLPKEDLD